MISISRVVDEWMMNWFSIYLSIIAAIVDTYRAIIDKFNLHHCLKDSVLNFVVLINLLHLINKVVVKLSSFVAPCRAMEIWLGALLGLGEKCKLGYYQ